MSIYPKKLYKSPANGKFDPSKHFVLVTSQEHEDAYLMMGFSDLATAYADKNPLKDEPSKLKDLVIFGVAVLLLVAVWIALAKYVIFV